MSTLSKIVAQVLRTGVSHTLTQTEMEAFATEHQQTMAPILLKLRDEQRQAFHAAHKGYLD